MSLSDVGETALTDSAIDSIAELQRRATKAEPFTVAAEPKDVYFIRAADGTTTRVVAEAAPIFDKLASPTELASYLRDLAQRGRKPADGIVRVFPSGVNYGFTFADRRHQASVPLVKTSAFAAVEQLAGQNYQGVTLTQSDVYRLLRVTLRGCLPDGSTLAAVIREVKFDNGVTTSGVIDQSRKNLGLSITGKVAGAGDAQIPESFYVTLSVFDNFTKPITVEIDLDTVPDQNKFRLTPYPGQIERAMRDTLASIRDIYDTSATDNSADSLCPSYIAQ